MATTERRAWRRAAAWIGALGIALLAEGPAAAFTAGTHELRLSHAGQERRALVHVPARTLGAPAPLVHALHGGGGHAESLADDERDGLISATERIGALLRTLQR